MKKKVSSNQIEKLENYRYSVDDDDFAQSSKVKDDVFGAAQKKKKSSEHEHGLTPGVIALIAILSVGGLTFLGWQASTVNNAIFEYNVCCTVQTWSQGAKGLYQGTAQTTTERIYPGETPSEGCVRKASLRNNAPVTLLGVVDGKCSFDRPQVQAPSYVPGGVPVCCTTDAWQNAPTGYAQLGARTATVFCGANEALGSCCMRADLRPGRIFVRGYRVGACEAAGVPQTSYPTWIAPK
jgi:hypothetical protein